MAGRRTREAPNLATPSMVASAKRYPGDVMAVYAGAKDWQKECYRHYNICGEARYAANYFGNSLSKAVLDIRKSPSDSTKLTSGPAVDTLAALFNGQAGQSHMLSAVGKHLTIAGECYIIGREVEIRDNDGKVIETDDVWEVLSVMEVKNSGGRWSITHDEEGKPDILLGKDAVVVRIWRPHPERRMEADSPFRSLLPILREIEWLTLHIFAQCSSRLTGAGLLFVTQGLEFAPPKDEDGKAIAFSNQAEGLLLAIANSMMRSIGDPSSPESLMPGVVTVPEEVMQGGKIAELLHFWTELDANSLTMRTAAVTRFAAGVDLPPETLLGMSSNSGTEGGRSNGINHWGGWQIKEETITLHVEPMLDLLVNAITVGIIRPVSGGEEVVGHSTEKLRLRPDRSKEAMELFNLGLLKGEVVVKENGFNPDTDMLDDKGRQSFLLMKIAVGSATPEQVGAALKELGVDLRIIDQGTDQRDKRPDPSLEEHPTRDIPEGPFTILTVSAEAIALQGLQRIGNRLRSSVPNPPTCSAAEMHTLIKANGSTDAVMKDAFPMASALLTGLADPAQVMPVIESYVAALLREQAPHSRERLNKYLTAAGL